MKEQPKENKLKINSKRIILLFSCVCLLIILLIYFSTQEKFWPLEQEFYIYAPLLVIITFIFCYLSVTKTYYEVDKHKITHHKMSKVFEYYYKDIIYIDENWSKKHKMLLFYDRNGKAKYLAFDKDQVIYDYAINYSPLITKEEFITRFPKIKL